MILTLVSETTLEPVTVDEVKTYMRIESTDSTSEDSMIGTFITVARRQAENITKRALIIQTRQVIIDDFANTSAVIELPRPPLSSSASDVTITYVKDTTVGDTTTIGSTVFTVDNDSEPGRIYPAFNNEWPTPRDQKNAITIQYVTGYSTATIPESITNWIKMRVLDMYENRESFSSSISLRVPRDYVNGVLDPYVILTMT